MGETPRGVSANPVPKIFLKISLDNADLYGMLGETEEKKMIDGYQKTYNFENGYGASVICNGFSYGGDRGLFEVAVLDAAGNITYDTPITGDVIGYLDFDGVAKTLREIQNLPTFANVDA